MRISAAQSLAALPDIAIGLTLLAVWVAPQRIGVDNVDYALSLMLLEFVIIHSAAFMGSVALAAIPRGRKSLMIVGLGAFYSLFVVGFALATGDWWMVWAFWGLTVNRLAGALVAARPSDEEARSILGSWALSALLYLFWVFATVVLPLPRLGITPGLIAPDPGSSGLWVDQPHRLLAAGAGYFLSQAFFELRVPRWVQTMKVMNQAKPMF